MTFLGGLYKMLARETRATTAAASDPYLAEFFGQRPGPGGAYVDPSRASGLATAQACVNLMAQGLASMPLHLYRLTGNGGRVKAADHPLYLTLHDRANAQQTAFEARETMIASLLITGNAYARLRWNGRGQCDELVPLDPGLVAVERLDGGRLRYRVSDRRGGVTIHLQEEILHLRFRLARDGVMGLSPVQMARETFNLALTQQDTAVRQAGKSFRPEGAVVFPEAISTDRRKDVLAALARKLEGSTATGGLMVLDGGVEWKSFAFSAKDAEFLESRRLTRLEICQVWGVPPTAVGILDHGTYSNVEQESRALVVRCLAPLAKRIEQAMNAALLTAGSRQTLFIEHDLAGLLRGDMAARFDAYRIGRQWGWLSANEIRGWENLPDIEGGDEYLAPLNMVPAGEREAADGA